MSKRISPEVFEQMSSATGLSGALHLLRGGEYDSIIKVYQSTGDIKMCELELKKKEIATVKNLLKYIQNDVFNFVQAILLKYEIDMLKHTIRLWFDREIRGRDIHPYVGYLVRENIVHNIPLDKLINAEDSGEIASILANTPYRNIVIEKLPGSEREGSLFSFETALDNLYYQEIFEAMKDLPSRDRKITERLFSAMVDLENLNRLVRFSRFYGFSYHQSIPHLIPYGKGTIVREAEELTVSGKEEESKQELYSSLLNTYGVSSELLFREQRDKREGLELINALMEDIIDREVQKILYGYPFTIGIILAYIIKKQKEVNRLIGILNKLNYDVREG